MLFVLRLYFYESLGFEHPHDGRSVFIDINPIVNPVALICCKVGADFLAWLE